MFVYDPAKNAWTKGPRLPRAISHAALVSTGKQLFVIGGYAGSTTKPVSTVRRLDQAGSRWVDAPSLRAPRLSDRLEIVRKKTRIDDLVVVDLAGDRAD